MSIVSLRAILFFLGTVMLLSGCKRAEKQFEAEGRSVMGIMRMLESYDFEHPTTPLTNLSQLFPGTGQGYPHAWHRRFAVFGRYAGFTNSIFEKYVFFRPGLTNQLVVGELVLMNAQPYPDGSGQLQRSVVSKGNNVYHWRTVREERVQRIFKELGVAEPKPMAMPRPPPVPTSQEYREPLSTSVARFYVRLTQSLGIDGDKWWILRDATIGVLLVVSFLTVFFFWRTRARRR